jgi:hypothetical protein
MKNVARDPRLADVSPVDREAQEPSPLIACVQHATSPAFIVFNEPIIGLVDQEVAETLFRFSRRVAEIIKLLDT